MHKLLLFTAVVGVSAFASPQAAPSATRVNPKACARISSSRTSTFPASFAYECLRSVPNRIQPAQQLIQSLKAFVEWQSTLAWLKNPPKSYGFPAVDIQGSLDKILETAKQGRYESEYDFQVAITQTISAAHDGHFFYTPDVFKAFTFENRLAQDIVSVSIDGVSLPKLYRFLQDFLTQCRSTKKQRLVIDLTSNGGGLIAAGFALFAQLFPGVNRFTANNMRLADSLVDISQIFSSLSPQDKAEASQTFGAFFNNISPTGVAEPQGDKFMSVADIMTPVTLQNDKFTEYIGEPYSVLAASGNGNGGQATSPSSPFKPENIVLLTDGACSSTCTTFSYLMLFQERVKTVSVGGRPQNTQMQSLGGVEGGQSLGMSDIAQAAFVALSLVAGQGQAQPKTPQNSDLGVLNKAYAVQRAADLNTPGGVNFKNNFAPSDSKTPLQFLYEPANCRFFYTLDMISNPEPVWEYAVDASWTDPEKYCVRGSRVAVDGPRPIDPAFAKDSATTGGNGGSAGNGKGGTDGTDGAKDEDENAAEGVLARSSIRIMCLLAVVSVLMLCL
ncbi:putative peptidase s41 family protein [Daldinia childiae]|uniref:putative peptidase s41 family protein n=1 Tax=Daldinia childiae TaxID=326645 RepID=UPI001445EC0A|nr:putative peptidase s41 family protein [Daldinia childiae]KAF3070975.1 putative peptidase s41 family protein [Daldinia childiae]